MDHLPSFALSVAGLSALKAHELVQKGIRVAEVFKVTDSLEFTGSDAARVLGVPPRTLQRWKGSKKLLDSGTGGRFYRLNHIVNLAVEVFQSLPAARQWLREPQQALGFKTPLELMNTDPGMNSVENLLGRIRHGVYS